MMKSLIATSILLLLPALTQAQQVKSCKGYVHGLNQWELIEKGKMIERFTLFDIDDWSDSTTFEMLAVKGGPTNAQLEIEFRDSAKGRTKAKQLLPLSTWERDKNLRVTLDLYPGDLFGKHPKGVFTLRLLSEGKSFCEDTHPITAHEED